LALSASLQPYAGVRTDEICEYPFAPKALARELTSNYLLRDGDGRIALPDAPGLGIEINHEAVRRYLVEVEIKAKNKVLFSSNVQTDRGI
jgi:L-alanine-DL-glutamate epimerase-like enolase superfamily enzyme